MTPQKYDRHYRQNRERKGRRAEQAASLILQMKGYRILERRWKSAAGEIDLIAAKADMLVFVEVKARRDHTTALEAVTWQTRRRIERAADIYAAKRHLQPLPVFRFDIFSVAGLTWRHHRHAWRSGD